MKKRLVKKIICYKQPNPCLLAHEQTPYNAHQWTKARTVMQRMVRLADQGDRWFRGPPTKAPAERVAKAVTRELARIAKGEPGPTDEAIQLAVMVSRAKR